MKNLLTKQRISVHTEGELVVFQVGNSIMRMPYEVAMQVSTWMRVRSKEAKKNAGDVSRHWSVVGKLDAIEAGERPW